MTFADIIARAVSEAVRVEVEIAYRNGYREAAAVYGRNLESTQRAYAEADEKACAYAAERLEEL